MRKSCPAPVDNNSSSEDAEAESDNDDMQAVPAKRGVGRPTKPGCPKMVFVKKPFVVRGRGRPIKDAKGRGRPKKFVQAESGEDDGSRLVVARGRGRPMKDAKGRGRPRKDDTKSPVKKPVVARGRGRPVKDAKGRGRPKGVVQAESGEDDGPNDNKLADSSDTRSPSKGRGRKEKA